MIYEETVRGKSIMLNVVIEREGNKWTYLIRSDERDEPFKIVDLEHNGRYFQSNRIDFVKTKQLKALVERYFTKEEVDKIGRDLNYSVTTDFEDLLRGVEFDFMLKISDPSYQLKFLEDAVEEIDVSDNITYKEVIVRAGLNSDDDKEMEVFKDFIMNHIVKNRDDCQRINDGQFKKMLIKSQGNDEKVFYVPVNQPFYEDENLIKKKELKQFLFDAEKLAINSGMIFLPFKIKNKAYLIIIDNLFEGLSIINVQGNFKYFNKQSNLYQTIYRNTKEAIKNEEDRFNDYLDYLSRNLRKSAGKNGKLLRKIWGTKLYDILKSPYLSIEFTDKQ
jgi:hypothetical protein